MNIKQLDLIQDSLPKFAYNLAANNTQIQKKIVGFSSLEPVTFDKPRTKILSKSPAALFDLAELQCSSKSLLRTNTSRKLKVVDLFSGCGGLSLGAKYAARNLNWEFEATMSCEISAPYSQVYEKNFSPKHSFSDSIENYLSYSSSLRLTNTEAELKKNIGPTDIIIGGPPCQGHSDLNNHTRRKDSRNELYFLMARAALVLRPEWLVIENVPGVVHAKNDVVAKTNKFLGDLGYKSITTSLNAADYGTAQSRKRHFTVASTRDLSSFSSIALNFQTPWRPVMWAISDLAEKYVDDDIFNSSSKHSKTNSGRINFLFDNDLYELPDSERPDCHRLKPHSYNSVYGRMRPDKPAPTITSGFGSTGQGRFVHPHERRTITPHEAARIQGFPDWYDFGEPGRRALQEMIGNMVPPKLSEAVITSLILSSLI